MKSLSIFSSISSLMLVLSTPQGFAVHEKRPLEDQAELPEGKYAKQVEIVEPAPISKTFPFFQSLPAPIQQHVFSFLDDKTFFSLQYVCKTWQPHIWPHTHTLEDITPTTFEEITYTPPHIIRPLSKHKVMVEFLGKFARKNAVYLSYMSILRVNLTRK